MAGKATRSGQSEPEPAASEASSSNAPELSSDAAGGVAGEAAGADASAQQSESTSTQPETADSSSSKPATDAPQDDAASRGSSESDEKAVLTSPSKKSPSKSKKGGRNSRGKSTSSKRSSEEQEATKETVVAEASSSAEKSNDDTTEEAAASGVAASTADASLISEASDGSHQKSTSTSKELAQLGLGSFGDGAEDDVVGPRRSRRGPGASPDPKTRVPKTEPDSDTTSLQDMASSTGNDASDAAAKAEQGDVNVGTEPAETSAVDVDDTAAPEEVAPDAEADTKPELDNHHEDAPAADAAEDSKHQNAVHDGDDEEAEANYADADDQDGDVDGEEAGDEGVTRCVCGSADENVGLMIQCETCKCWQHCVCMGMQVEEDCPDVYFCEQCHPELHIPLLRSLGLLPKSSKKGTSKGGPKYSARELKEAKEAIAMLAQENARRQQAAEAAANYGSRDRKGSNNPRGDASKEVPKSPKRRSTMNSRDSAYGGWEPIPPGLLADGEVWEGAEDRKGGKKRKRGLPDEYADSNAETPEAADNFADAASDAAKRRRMSAGTGHEQDGDADMDEDETSAAADHSASTSRDKSHKKKKGNNQYTVRESSAAPDSASSKPRHPNQYTYRNKDRNGGAAAPSNGQKTGSSSTSNLTSHSPSPSPSKGRAENARRAAARDHGSQIGTPAPGEVSSSGRGGHSTSSTQWSLPEHLAHLAYLLPHAAKSRHEAAKSSASAADNGSASGSGSTTKKSSASSSGQTSSVPSPPAGTSFPTPFQVISSIEASTKVRFPGRRMTMGEMRKRVRNIGEYVTRSQIEAVEREKRMKLLGIVPPYMEETEEEAELDVETMQDDVKEADGATSTEAAAEDYATDGAATDASAPAKAKQQLPLSMRLMEELTRELIHFQRNFGVGPGSHSGSGSSHPSAAVS